MRRSKVSQREEQFIRQKLQEAFGYNDEQLIEQLDRAAAEYAAHPELNLNPPEHEFEKIMAMAAQNDEKTGGEADSKISGTTQSEKKHKVIRLRRILKPVVLVAAITGIMLGTGMMANGRRQYKFWDRTAGKGEIIFNNVDALYGVDSLEQAYQTIEQQTAIKVIELFYIPRGMAFKEVLVDKGTSRINLSYEGTNVYFYQVLKENINSTGYKSDRETYKTVYNRFLGKEISVYKNVIDATTIEFSAHFVDENTFYYLVGTIDEETFEKIVSNLYYFE